MLLDRSDAEDRADVTRGGHDAAAVIDGATDARSRRAVLAAAAVGAAGLVAASLRAPITAEAADGGNFILGQANSATFATTLSAAAGNNLLGAFGVSASLGHAVDAETTSATAGAAIQARGPRGALSGYSTDPSYPGLSGQGLPGVLGYGGTGLAGFGSAINPPTAVPDGRGVYASGDGVGLDAVSVAGTAVVATSDTGKGVIAQTTGGVIAAQAFAGSGTPPKTPPETYSLPTGVFGEAAGHSPTGVWGEGGTVASGSSTGVYGEGDTGVWGFGGWGVFGASDATGTGVYGFSGATVPSAPAHTGVFGYTDSGTGVYAQAATGTALYVNGKVRFSRSNVTYVAAGHSSRKVTLAGVTTSSWVIATPKTNRAGVFVQAVVPGAGYFTIYLNKTVAGTTYVGYLVIN
jgi:hypothetical protein